MNRNSCCCHPQRPQKKSRKKKCRGEYKKIGAAMLLLGLATVMFLLLPVKCWVIILAIVLIICGMLLIK